jgi:hypothetical protein
MDNVREDTGYVGYNGIARIKPEKVKIEYTGGLMPGLICSVRRDIAEQLIREGRAREVK